MKSLLPGKRITYFFCFLLFGVACKKKEPNTDAEPFVPPDVKAPAYSFSRYDANGLLKIQKTFSYYNDPLNGLIKTISIDAKAAFKTSFFDTTYNNAGNVSCQGRSLAIISNQSYVLEGNAAASIGFNDTTGVTWNISGNTSTGIPTFIYLTSYRMPEYKGISNNSIPSNIRRSTGFVIPLGANVVGADSIFVSITVGEKSVMKTLGGFVTNCEFANTELSILSATNGASGLLQVSAIKFDGAVQGGKKMYFANQSTYTKLVEVQ